MSMRARQPLWISHRGLHKVATENSLNAFRAAIAAGFDGLETDLRTTADGQIILSHDASLLRVSGADIAIGETHASDLLGVKLQDGQPLLSLEQFIEAFPTAPWIFDIKPEQAMATIAALARLSTRPGVREKLLHQARFLFWRREHQQAFRTSFPQATLIAMEWECYLAGLAVMCRVPALGRIRSGVTYGITARFAGIDLFRPAFVKCYKDRGARTLAYLPTSPDDFAAAITSGMDEILSDGYIQK